MAKNLDSLGLSGVVVDGKYRVERPVGEGGFSVVYRAKHVLWQQPVALKCFNTLARSRRRCARSSSRVSSRRAS
jgi:serine/threonine protein kinase